MKLTEILLTEMATKLLPSQTGVNAIIWVSSSEFEGKKLPVGHDRRIKVKNGPGNTDFASVDIDTKEVLGNLDTEVAKQVVQFIYRNYNVLARIWEQGPGNERKWVRDIRPLPHKGWSK